MANTPFKTITGETEAGGCDFTICLGDLSWSCRASYIGSYPLLGLIGSAVGIYLHSTGIDPDKPDQWDIAVCDEPGGLYIRSEAKGKQVKVSIYEFPEDGPYPEPFCPLDIPLLAEGVVDYWDYASAVLDDAAHALAKQGLVKLCGNWDLGGLGYTLAPAPFPTETFIYLATLVKYRKPNIEMSLLEEVALLQELVEK